MDVTVAALFVVTTLLFWLAPGAVYAALVAAANVLYRLATRGWFRWVSRRTVVPLLLLGPLAAWLAYATWAR